MAPPELHAPQVQLMVLAVHIWNVPTKLLLQQCLHLHSTLDPTHDWWCPITTLADYFIRTVTLSGQVSDYSCGYIFRHPVKSSKPIKCWTELQTNRITIDRSSMLHLSRVPSLFIQNPGLSAFSYFHFTSFNRRLARDCQWPHFGCFLCILFVLRNSFCYFSKFGILGQCILK